MSNFKKKIKSDILNDLDTPNVLESVKSNATFLNTNVSSPKVKTFNFRRLSRVLTVSLSVAAIVIVGILILPNMGLGNSSNDAMKEPESIPYEDDFDKKDKHDNSDSSDYEDETRRNEPSYSGGETILVEEFVSQYYNDVVTNSLDISALSDLYQTVYNDVEKGMTLDEILLELGTTNEESITNIYNYLTK